MRPKKLKTFIADFETTVYEGQTRTDVWSAALVEMYTEDVKIFHSIKDFMDYVLNMGCHAVIYFHNLKFDGEFILWHLMNETTYKEALDGEEWLRDNKMPDHSYKYMISYMGQWYSLKVKTRKKIIEFRDSLKLLPFSVAQIGKAFNTKHQKLTMEYEGLRYPGCEITPEEEEYIKNDVLVVKEALEFMYEAGHDKMTIGSCCMSEYKGHWAHRFYNILFPDLSDIEIDRGVYGSESAFLYLHKSYHGGWCYVKPERAMQVIGGGWTADVNSLYPSMMHSESGNIYPIGKPHFWTGNYIPDKVLNNGLYYFIRIRTRFYLRPGKLPTIQIKGSTFYKSTQWLTTSDYVDKNGDAWEYLRDRDGSRREMIPTLTLTCTDYDLLREHYVLKDFEILDGCWFYTETGLFDSYINKYKEIKMNSKGAMRTLAKLFLNNLYGKFAMNSNSSFKTAFKGENGGVGYHIVDENKKKTGYIAVGSAITSYARAFTIRAAQANYDAFIYADTDSIHCEGRPEDAKGITVHPTAFCCWKLETCWDFGLFIRQKTYIEHVIEEDQEPIERPWYNIKCAGMPESCKKIFMLSVNTDIPISDEEKNKMSRAVKAFLFDENGNRIKREIEDFKPGLMVPGKLVPLHIPGGVLLHETEYTLREAR